MLRILLFDAVQIAACVYALWRGAYPERLVATLMFVAATLTELLPTQPGVSFFVVERVELFIDAAMMLGLTAVAARAQRFWPLWVAALQLLAIGIHGVRAYDSHILPIVYARAAGEIAYPMILLLVLGTYRHTVRIKKHGSEPDWSPWKLY